jgi:hypothetical protein
MNRLEQLEPMPAADGQRAGSAGPAALHESAAASRAALAAGVSPLEYMLGVMRDPAADDKRRDDMAKAAAPYAHSRLGVGAEASDGPPIIIIKRFAN